VRTPELAYATKDNIEHPGPYGAAVDAQARAVLVSEDVFNVSGPYRVDVAPELLVNAAYEDSDVDGEELREQFEADVEAEVENKRSDRDES
jgi:hypothetical protein